MSRPFIFCILVFCEALALVVSLFTLYTYLIVPVMKKLFESKSPIMFHSLSLKQAKIAHCMHDMCQFPADM